MRWLILICALLGAVQVTVLVRWPDLLWVVIPAVAVAFGGVLTLWWWMHSGEWWWTTWKKRQG